MNDACRQFDTLIARSAQLTAEQASKLDAHLASCGSCRELARAVQPVNADVAFAATGMTETMPDDTQASGTGSRDDRGLPEVATERYRITGEVGRGGIGRVLRALDRVLDRPVALKELFSASDDMRRRFMREALITARLQHPSIVPVYDAGNLGDRSPFYAMKLVAGRPLDKAIAEATTLAQRLALLPSVLAVADAVAYAHNERIIHRDLKPMNVLVGKYGETIVIDWGLAKDLAVDDQDALDAGPYRAAGLEHTVAGAVMGTPAFMAPEQAAGEPVDERADVYALGAILYHVISGAIPHEGTTLEEMVHRVISGDVRPLMEREPEVPRDLAAIVHKAMALEPAKRYPNAQGLADDLRRFLTGQLVASHTYGTRELLRRWVRRHRGAVTVALAALVVVSIIAVVSFVRIVRAGRAADKAAAIATKERSIAEQQKNSATEMLADMLTEHGRQELLAGQPGRAAVYLSQAQAQTHKASVALRSFLADAMRSLDAQRFSLEGHTKEINSAAFSSDGTRVVTASDDETAIVWDSATGKVVATLTGHSDVVSSASFAPDDSRIVTASDDHTAIIWDARTGRVLATLDHPDEVWWATFSPDGASVVTTGEGGTARLWSASTGQLLNSFKGHHALVYMAAFSADGARVVTASADHTAKVWDTKTGKLLLSLDGHRADVEWAAFSRDGSQIVTASDDMTSRLWDARTGKLLASLEGHAAAVFSATYSPDGTHIVTASEDRTAKLWDARTGKLLASLEGHTGAVHSAEFSPDGSQVVTASFGTARLWDVPTAKLLAVFDGHHGDVRSAVFNRDATQILTASRDGTAKLWDAKPSKLRVSLDGATTTSIAAGAFSPAGSTIVTTAKSVHTAKLRDARSGKLIATLDGHRGDIVDVHFDSVGTRVVTASVDHTAKVWDAKTGKLLVSLDHTKVRSVRSSPDGLRVITVGADPGARLWNAETGELIAKLDGGDEDEVHAVAFSSDSRRVAIASANGTGRIWRTDNGKLVADLEGHHHGDIYSTAFSADGERVVTASEDHTAKVWNARTGELVASLEGHTDQVHSASFSPDGTRVVTASDDHTAKLWDARTGKLLASCDGHKDAVLGATFTPDPEGARVLTVSVDHTAKLWDAKTGKLVGSLDDLKDDLFGLTLSADGNRVLTASRDGTIWSWDVHLEQREPAAIARIVSARAPWRLTDGGLVPVATP